MMLLQADQSSELAALNAEADMPLEELLAMYKRGDDGQSDQSDEDRMSIELPIGTLLAPFTVNGMCPCTHCFASPLL